ncbi:hypothetical protein EDD18DRAFT_1105231 [Armillaria luteobubalina]|uniref:Uncharacterized protein n=1 Tax=Armillaria luteobubalina TaxID=153913 RepID=A0AA39Q673_9AGAR|nr:hypothetical protein EDD18DRAFT_1105231 [Armillaria luteobubalina]
MLSQVENYSYLMKCQVTQDVTMSDQDNELEVLQEAHRSQIEQIVQQQHHLDEEQEMHCQALQQTQQEFEQKLADALQNECAEAQRKPHEGPERQHTEAEKAFENSQWEWEKRMVHISLNLSFIVSHFSQNKQSAEVLAIHQHSQSHAAASSLSLARSPVPSPDLWDGPVNPAAAPAPPTVQDSTAPISPAAVLTPPSLVDISTPEVKMMLCQLLSTFGLTTVPEQATNRGLVHPTMEGNIGPDQQNHWRKKIHMVWYKEFGVEKQEDFGAYMPADEDLVSAYDNG